MRRRLSGCFAIALAACLGAGAIEAGPKAPARVAVRAGDGPFTIVIVPDTQHEVDTLPDDSTALEFSWQLPRFERNAAWICEQRDALRIAAVLHVGDFVQAQPRGVHTQWDSVARFLGRIEACGVPWLGALGNHDCDAGPNGCGLVGGGDRASNFQQHVMQRQARQPEWQGAGPELRPEHGRCGLGGAPRAPSRSGWIRFAGNFAALALDWAPDCKGQDDWARGVLEQHGGDTHFVLLGHGLARPGDSPACAGATEPGQALRAGQLARVGGVFAVVGGHYIQDPNYSCYGSSANAGRPVVNAFSNFQTNGGKEIAGTLVLMRIDVAAYPARPNLCLRQVNPSLEAYDVTEPERCFDLPQLGRAR